MAMSFLKYAELYPDAATRKLERAGNKIARLAAKGICTHGHLHGPPGRANVKCLSCGKEFDTWEAAWAANKEAMES
jgi:hypothetical protein